ncbi:MAG: SDR family oxidoreductase [Sulfuricaulis sp.]
MTSNLSGCRILVTGATGFIGSNLVKKLLTQGAIVYAYVRDISKAGDTGSYPGVQFIQGDLTQGFTWTEPVAVDTIFHLAGYAHAVSDLDDASDRLHHANTVIATRHLLEMAGKTGVKEFIFASSVKAMSESTGTGCLDETSPAMPRSAYGRAKLEAEGLVLSAGDKYGIHACNLRMPMVFGHGIKGNLLRMIEAIDHGRFPPLPEVNNKRSLVHVDDVIQGMLLAARHPGARGKTFIITDGRVYSTRQIYTAICAALGRNIPAWTIPVGALYAVAKIGDFLGRLRGKRFILDSDSLDKLVGSACYSSDKISHFLGYRPERNLLEALPEMISAYRRSKVVG